MTMAELEAWLAAQIIGPYHAERHRSLGIPPSLAWDEALARRPELTRHPLDADSFLFDFLPCVNRAVTPNGIELNCGIVYLVMGYGSKAVLRTRPEAAKAVGRISGAIMIGLAFVLAIETVSLR